MCASMTSAQWCVAHYSQTTSGANTGGVITNTEEGRSEARMRQVRTAWPTYFNQTVEGRLPSDSQYTM